MDGQRAVGDLNRHISGVKNRHEPRSAIRVNLKLDVVRIARGIYLSGSH
jgi:hypothetical protein